MTTRPHDPAVIGSFTIQGRLGRGAMGAVYLARSPGGRLVAVKVVRDELAGDAAFRARFAREIEAARQVGGAYTAAVVDADPDAEHPWLATEYLPGPTLQKAIDTSGPLTPGGVQSLAGGLAEALMAIHASGVIHRDLKPSNIVLTDNGPRVIDFGIARALEEASLTATGVVVGTPGYLSPEQITGTAIGPPSDVFALGAVLVFAASGRGPFAHGNPASLLHRVAHEQPHIPPLPNPLQDVVRRCLARDPRSGRRHKSYSSCSDYPRAQPSSARPPRRSPTRHRQPNSSPHNRKPCNRKSHNRTPRSRKPHSRRLRNRHQRNRGRHHRRAPPSAPAGRGRRSSQASPPSSSSPSSSATPKCKPSTQQSPHSSASST